MKRHPNRRRSPVVAGPVAAAQIQVLESKQLLTGTVTVSLSGSGDVSVTGDNEDNEVIIEVDEGGASITGLSGTSVRIGDETFGPGETAFITAAAVVPRDLKVNLKGGDDVLGIYIDDETSIGRNVSIDMGAGDNDLLLHATDSLEIGGKLSVKSGAGSDYVEISAAGAGGLIEVAGDAAIDTGKGNDGLLIGDWDLFADIFTEDEDDDEEEDEGEGEGEDEELAQALPAGVVDEFLSIPDNSGSPAAQAVQFGGNLSVKTGKGSDLLGIIGVAVARDAIIHTGTGHGDVLGVSNLSVGRNLNLTYGDLNAVQNVTVGGKTKLKSGTGDDRFALDRVRMKGDVDLNLGAGNDQLALGEDVVAEKKVKLNGGLGTDSLASAINLNGADVSGFEGSAVDFEAIVEDVLELLSLFSPAPLTNISTGLTITFTSQAPSPPTFTPISE